FALEDVRKQTPDFWFELTTWDGDKDATVHANGKRQQLAAHGAQLYNPDRYQGLLQYGLWLLRPRALRDHRYLDSLAFDGPSFLANVKAVDQVYASPILQRFWRKGTLVANPERQHPYQAGASTPALTEDLKRRTRWFLLKTDLESPAKNWGMYTEVPV